MQRSHSIVLSGLLLISAPISLAQDPSPTGRPAFSAPKGANTPLQAAQIPPPPPSVQPSQPSPAPPTSTAKAPTLKPGEVLLNFQAAEIQGVVKAVGQMTKRNFLLDPRVKGQITIISAHPVTTAAAYQIFLSALKAQGFTAVEGIGATRIVPTTEGKANAEVNMSDEPRGGERIMTHVLIVQHTSATQMIPLLRPLMSPTSQLSAYDLANALIITDYAENIRRLLRIVEKIDQPVSSDVTIITLKHASALDLADLVTRLSLPGASSPGQPVQPGQPHTGAGGAGDRFNIVPDLRTNSLLVRADNPGRVNQIRSLIEKLDVPALVGGQTRVIYLRNADAVKLAEVLRGLLAGEARSQSSAAPATASGTRSAAAASKPAEASLVQADEATNALIINAADATYNNLRGVIEKLDVRRTQVYVEALIVEMSTDAARELGVQWSGGKTTDGGTYLAGQNFPAANPSIISASAGIASSPPLFPNAGGLTLGFLSELRLTDGTIISGLGALARAMETRGLANILSTPNLMTLDNAEAKIVVGQNVPFVTGSFTQPTGTTAANPFQTIERKDVGLTLKIKPQVSEGGTIKLDIFQEVSNVERTLTSGASDLITNKRSIETKVLVDDGHTIILGGLIEDNKTETEQSVPLLGRLPLIGGLFRYTSKTGKRTNLMVFLRPVIVHGPQDSFSVTTDRYKYLRARSQDLGRQDLLDRFAPKTPTEEELKKYKKRSNESEKSNEPDVKPSVNASGTEVKAETPTSDTPVDAPDVIPE